MALYTSRPQPSPLSEHRERLPTPLGVRPKSPAGPKPALHLLYLHSRSPACLSPSATCLDGRVYPPGGSWTERLFPRGPALITLIPHLSWLTLLPANLGGSASSQNPLSASCAAFTPACLAPLTSLPTCLLPLLATSTFSPHPGLMCMAPSTLIGLVFPQQTQRRLVHMAVLEGEATPVLLQDAGGAPAHQPSCQLCFQNPVPVAKCSL